MKQGMKPRCGKYYNKNEARLCIMRRSSMHRGFREDIFNSNVYKRKTPLGHWMSAGRQTARHLFYTIHTLFMHYPYTIYTPSIHHQRRMDAPSINLPAACAVLKGPKHT